MTTPKTPSAPPAEWNPGEIQVCQEPPPYEDLVPPPYNVYNTGYSPLSGGYSYQPRYPSYGPAYGQRHEGYLLASNTGRQVVTVQPMCVPPTMNAVRDYLCCSIFSMMFCCVLGIPALVFSIKTRDANLINNRRQAKKYSEAACALNTAAMVIGIAALLTSVVLYMMARIRYCRRLECL